MEEEIENKVAQEILSSQKVSSTLASGIDLDSRTIYLIGEIDEKTCYHFMVALAHLDVTPGEIRLVISSPGGLEHYGYAIYDALRNAENTVVATGYGTVASMASAILQGADVRCLSENCEFMIHNGSMQVGAEHVDQDTILDMAEQVKNSSRKYHEILFENSNLSLEEIRDYCDKEKTFNAQEAVQAGFADLVVKLKKSKKHKKVKRKGKRS